MAATEPVAAQLSPGTVSLTLGLKSSRRTEPGFDVFDENRLAGKRLTGVKWFFFFLCLQNCHVWDTSNNTTPYSGSIGLGVDEERS